MIKEIRTFLVALKKRNKLWFIYFLFYYLFSDNKIFTFLQKKIINKNKKNVEFRELSQNSFLVITHFHIFVNVSHNLFRVVGKKKILWHKTRRIKNIFYKNKKFVKSLKKCYSKEKKKKIEKGKRRQSKIDFFNTKN